MTLDGIDYAPTLAIRASEMNGLHYLPGATKDRMTPCILLAPWANAGSLAKAMERVERAYRGRAYFLDIDRDYELTNLESAPQQELVELRIGVTGVQPQKAFVPKVGLGKSAVAIYRLQTAIFLIGEINPSAEGVLLCAGFDAQSGFVVFAFLGAIYQIFVSGFREKITGNIKIAGFWRGTFARCCGKLPFFLGQQSTGKAV